MTDVIGASAFALGIEAGLPYSRVVAMAHEGLIDEDDWRKEVRAMRVAAERRVEGVHAEAAQESKVEGTADPSSVLESASVLVNRLFSGIGGGRGSRSAAAEQARAAKEGSQGERVPEPAAKRLLVPPEEEEEEPDVLKPAPRPAEAERCELRQRAESALAVSSTFSAPALRPRALTAPPGRSGGALVDRAFAAVARAGPEGAGEAWPAVIRALGVVSRQAGDVGSASVFAFLAAGSDSGSASVGAGERMGTSKRKGVARVSRVVTAALQAMLHPTALSREALLSARQALASTAASASGKSLGVVAGRRSFVMSSLGQAEDADARKDATSGAVEDSSLPALKLALAQAALEAFGALAAPGIVAVACLRFAEDRLAAGSSWDEQACTQAHQAISLAQNIISQAAACGWAYDWADSLDAALAEGNASSALRLLQQGPSASKWHMLEGVEGGAAPAWARSRSLVDAVACVVLPRLAALVGLAREASSAAASTGAALLRRLARLVGQCCSPGLAALLCTPEGSSRLRKALTLFAPDKAADKATHAWRLVSAQQLEDAFGTGPRGNGLAFLALQGAQESASLFDVLAAAASVRAAVSVSPAEESAVADVDLWLGQVIPRTSVSASLDTGIASGSGIGRANSGRHSSDEEDEFGESDADDDVVMEMRRCALGASRTLMRAAAAALAGPVQEAKVAAIAAVVSAASDSLMAAGLQEASVLLLAGMAKTACAAGRAIAMLPDRAVIHRWWLDAARGRVARAPNAESAAQTRASALEADVELWEPWLAAAAARAAPSSAPPIASAWAHVHAAAAHALVASSAEHVAATLCANVGWLAAKQGGPDATVAELLGTVGSRAISKALDRPACLALASAVSASDSAMALLEDAYACEERIDHLRGPVCTALEEELMVSRATRVHPAAATLARLQLDGVEAESGVQAGVCTDESLAERLVLASRAQLGAGDSERLGTLRAMAARVNALAERVDDAAGRIHRLSGAVAPSMAPQLMLPATVWRSALTTAVGRVDAVAERDAVDLALTLRQPAPSHVSARGPAANVVLALTALGNPCTGEAW
ncbi:hypothetical protein FNF27_00130 [Cafeteria roenbergensis]|uniref:Uncharacterized protein n=2 Tax=Cafeteria roenbergensis TaxID=33653 RepID=A0A5A8ENM9_CAFRO|nr:hypothetical protein FNF27_00130 [Cafeteria roenbergensis]